MMVVQYIVISLRFESRGLVVAMESMVLRANSCCQNRSEGGQCCL